MLNYLKRTRLSCDRMIWLLACSLPTPLSCQKDPATHKKTEKEREGRGKGVAKSRIIRRRESLVLYTSFHTFWRKPFHANDFFPDSFLPHFSFFNSAEKITPAGLVSFKTDLKSKRRGYKNIDLCNGASVYFVFCRLCPFSPSHHGRVWVLPGISLLLTNTVSPVLPRPII